jgi:phenylacetate-CoA ligase
VNSHLVALYHCLPAPARSAAATLRGWYLNRWRRGEAAAQLRAEALERDGWSAAQWKTWQDERLAYVLHRAATRVPYYRAQWESRRARGDHGSWERIENWPLLEKDAVRSNPRAFLADDCDTRRMAKEQTSGTTGTPLQIWRSRTTVATLYAIASARTRGWDNIEPGARWARLGGQLVIPVQQRRPPFWVWNAAMRQLYLSSYHLAADLIPHYFDALVDHRIEYISGYPSSLFALAQQAIRTGRTDVRLAAVYTNAEPLYAEQRRTIAKAFGCPVRQTYGMVETVAAASECAHGRMHLWPEAGYVEQMADGELICTGLLNADMPLIRYRIGDRARLAPDDPPCPCNRSLPRLSNIEGRAVDGLVTRDGRAAGPVDPIFDGMVPIREAQIIQEAIDLLRVRVATAPGFTAADEDRIAVGLRNRMGDVRVVVDRVDAIPRSANGKLRAVICALSEQERGATLASVSSM